MAGDKCQDAEGVLRLAVSNVNSFSEQKAAFVVENLSQIKLWLLQDLALDGVVKVTLVLREDD